MTRSNAFGTKPGYSDSHNCLRVLTRIW
ncbi:hypothetical protein F383_39158 [Gossypium arboreum]|uniref:Uncharacterized protein n=1 Tax=Gossypium arboreum TaxID=29729 RepID=A0A0B0MG42_GOSAR|nr:hypothetical protein F383_39158 [Gossypium arboreum]